MKSLQITLVQLTHVWYTHIYGSSFHDKTLKPIPSPRYLNKPTPPLSPEPRLRKADGEGGEGEGGAGDDPSARHLAEEKKAGKKAGTAAGTAGAAGAAGAAGTGGDGEEGRGGGRRSEGGGWLSTSTHRVFDLLEREGLLHSAVKNEQLLQVRV